MPAPPPRAASASSSASTSSLDRRRPRQDLSDRLTSPLSLSPSLPSRGLRLPAVRRTFAVSGAAAVHLDDQQRLRRIAQQVEEIAVRVARRSSWPSVRSVSGPPPPIVSNSRTPNCSRSVSSSRRSCADRHPLPAQVGEHQQLEQIDRRVAPLGVAAGAVFFDAMCEREQPPRIPPLQLPGREAGHRRDFARRVGVLQLAS